ncbi:hypothetical protein [Amycolatopsis jiangsuensis]|uniref:Uncharacterized protein n=1 Tax=Amycolatopsis jiangsuensis TaxID=1181879 RepID=A0A840J706_9PSEU|nr:hypothetical protein [Amycolatopsis jiangsuensis]MBB4689573.1 hypothetical protein [Amycolatopsis jiangsuensis]
MEVKVRREQEGHCPVEQSLRRLTLREWLRGVRADFVQSEVARGALCEHDGTTAPCWLCCTAYW